MKENYAHICIVLDASGSMMGLEEETRSSLEKFVKDQLEEPGDATVSFYQFDDNTEKLLDFVNLQDPQLVEQMQKYTCGGCTALYDAIGTAIDETGKHLADLAESDRPARVLFVILTDGMENASREYNSARVKKMITHQTDVYSWKFLYLAANQDAFASGGELGIGRDFCANIVACCAGDMDRNARIFSQGVRRMRSMTSQEAFSLSDIADSLDDEPAKPRKRSGKGKKQA